MDGRMFSGSSSQLRGLDEVCGTAGLGGGERGGGEGMFPGSSSSHVNLIALNTGNLFLVCSLINCLLLYSDLIMGWSGELGSWGAGWLGLV